MVPVEIDEFGHKKNTRQIGLWIDEVILDKWDQFCEANGVKRTDLIKHAVNEYILKYSSIHPNKIAELERKIDSYAEKLDLLFERIDNTKGKAREEGWERALDYFDIVYKQVPVNLQNKDWLLGLSFRLSMLFEIKRYQEILQEVERLGLKLTNPEHWDAFHYAAKAHIELKEMNQAHDILDRLIAGTTANDEYSKPLLYITKGEAFQKQGKFPEAAAQFALAFQRDPQNPQAHLKYADFLKQKYKLSRSAQDPSAEQYRKDAERYYQKALTLAPANSDVHGEYANYLWMCEEKEVVQKLPPEVKAAAEEQYRKALELNPNNTTVLTFYAFFLFWAKKDFAPIPSLFDKAIELEPKHLGHYLNYAGVLQMIDQEQSSTTHKETIEHLYEQAIQVDPASEAPHKLLAEYQQNDKKVP